MSWITVLLIVLLALMATLEPLEIEVRSLKIRLSKNISKHLRSTIMFVVTALLTMYSLGLIG